MFRLTYDEIQKCSRSYIETLKGRGHNVKYLSYVFIEEGVSVLAIDVYFK